MSVSSTTFREALSHFASGVVIVAAYAPADPVGFTASAFTSVSLEPPLVLVCISKRASAYPGIVGATKFGISILHETQLWIAEQFARHGAARFAGVQLRRDAQTPLVEGALAQLECAPHALHDAGDHTIVVGRVVEAFYRPARPLLHYQRAFGGFVGGAAFAYANGVGDGPNGGAP